MSALLRWAVPDTAFNPTLMELVHQVTEGEYLRGYHVGALQVQIEELQRREREWLTEEADVGRYLL